ncbi:hypothetical protein CEXT_446771 [Caerostris extrusa]|uniref:Uncharacterized protein n=1 Tax=Caerostris extrusa TaxID=172846 RepID=A0AAV4RD93_CAEEX|nr:hypothetical protein CEXT_446771 [Caerostris extrusa]
MFVTMSTQAASSQGLCLNEFSFTSNTCGNLSTSKDEDIITVNLISISSSSALALVTKPPGRPGVALRQLRQSPEGPQRFWQRGPLAPSIFSYKCNKKIHVVNARIT